MFKKKLSFLLFLSFLSSNLQSAESVIGRKLCGSFHLEIEKKGARFYPFPHQVRIKIVPEEKFSGFGSDSIEGFAGVLFGSKKVFFKLPKQKNPISLAAFLAALNNGENLPVECTQIINLFFQQKKTENMLSSFTFEDAYEVTLNDTQALVLTPSIIKDTLNV